MLLVLFASLYHTGLGQYAEINMLKGSPGVFFLPAHTQLNKVAWRDSVYMFPIFEYGKIIFDTGYTPGDSLLLNYDLYLDGWDMININGDTLPIKLANGIKLITIGSQNLLSRFQNRLHRDYSAIANSTWGSKYNDTEHMQYVSGNRDGTIAGTDVRGIPSVYDRYYRKRKHYYVIGKDNKALKANDVSLFKLFPEHKKTIKAYVDENNIDFTNENDLIKLLTFCNSLK
jgi:hypothetical protein